MVTKDEALKMAIEAMDMDNDCECGRSNEVVSALINALEACKEALKNLEKDPPISRNEQPAQEPVAWMSKKRGDVSKAKMYFNEGEEILPLYTHPAPSWQGLSDDEIQDAWYKLYPLDKNNLWDDMMIGKHLDKFAHAIEQSLKEKNNVSNS